MPRLRAHTREAVKTVDVLMPAEDVMQATGITSRLSLDKYVSTGWFPTPVEVGPPRRNGTAGKYAWLKSEVDAWILARAAARPVASPLAAFDGASQPA
jgi:predicted DNA-binding transcriptional regulator AlpA